MAKQKKTEPTPPETPTEIPTETPKGIVLPSGNILIKS